MPNTLHRRDTVSKKMPRRYRQEAVANESVTEDSKEMKRKIEKFSFKHFNVEQVSIESYIGHFLRTCRVKGIDGDGVEDAKKDLLLTYIGPSTLTDVETYFLPENVDDVSFEQIVDGLKSLYKPAQTIFCLGLNLKKHLERRVNHF